MNIFIVFFLFTHMYLNQRRSTRTGTALRPVAGASGSAWAVAGGFVAAAGLGGVVALCDTRT